MRKWILKADELASYWQANVMTIEANSYLEAKAKAIRGEWLDCADNKIDYGSEQSLCVEIDDNEQMYLDGRPIEQKIVAVKLKYTPNENSIFQKEESDHTDRSRRTGRTLPCKMEFIRVSTILD